jgi:hypothetical protein
MGFTKANYITSPTSKTKQLLYVGLDGSININLLGLDEDIKSTAISFSAGQMFKMPTTPLSDRKTLTIYPNLYADGNFYVGGPSLTTSNGLPLDSQAYIVIDAGPSVDVWGVSDISGEVRILEVS